MIKSKPMSTIVNGEMIAIDSVTFNVEQGLLSSPAPVYKLKGITTDGTEITLTSVNAVDQVNTYIRKVITVPVSSIWYEIDNNESLYKLNSVIIVTSNAFPIYL